MSVLLLEAHKYLTYLGGALLAVTFLLNYEYSQADNVGDEFNYAYVTGIVMLASFVASLAIFTKAKMRRGFAS